MTLYYIYLVLIVVSFLASLSVYAKKENPLYLKIFPVLLLATFLVEIIAKKIGDAKGNNLLLYSLFSAAEFGFYLFFFSSVYRENKAKKTAFNSMMIYLILALINIFFVQRMKVFHTYTFMLGCVLILGFGAYYFFDLIRATQTGKLSRNPAFWITAALMVYYCCDLPVFGILNYITFLSPGTYRGLLVVYNFMNIILYSLFTVAFLCQINSRKYTS
jgi:hypothetical protein